MSLCLHQSPREWLKHCTSLCHVDSSSAPIEQLNAKLPLQSLDPVREGRLRQI